MAADPLFRMTVQDVFTIRGRGTVVTGRVEQGTLHVGDTIQILHQGIAKKSVVKGIEAFRKVLPYAQAGDNIGVLFSDLTKTEIQQGDLLLAADTQFG